MEYRDDKSPALGKWDLVENYPKYPQGMRAFKKP